MRQRRRHAAEPLAFDWKRPDYRMVMEWRMERLARIRAEPAVLPTRIPLTCTPVRHTLKRHGDEASEKAVGQFAVTAADIAGIDSVIMKPDRVVFGSKNPRGQDNIAYIKRMSDGTVLAVEEVRTGKKALALASLRKYPAAKDLTAVANSVLSYAQSDGGTQRIVYDCSGEESDSNA